MATKTKPKLRSLTARATAPRCACNCGETTQGGHYKPGHDAKHRSRLLMTARQRSGKVAQNALQQLKEHGWLSTAHA